MRLPNRKNPALYKIDGNTIEILAYFRDKDSACKFEQILDNILEMDKKGINKR